VETVDTWTGRAASQLQKALRMTNQAFAARIGVAERTVASWHSRPDIVPRAEIQSALDTLHQGADATVLRRFQALSRPTSAATAQALRVAIAIVVRDEQVLLVCRRGDDSLTWQFPAGMVKPGASGEAVAMAETHGETGVHCAVRQPLGSRIHPTKGVLCEYFLCDWLMGDASNRDPLENSDAQWVPISHLPRFIPTEQIYPPILEVLA
jgi:8-oxo-dGTP pyrophosphatase MutT (NUDIX family)